MSSDTHGAGDAVPLPPQDATPGNDGAAGGAGTNHPAPAQPTILAQPSGVPGPEGRAAGSVTGGPVGASVDPDTTQELPARLRPRPSRRPSRWRAVGLLALAVVAIIGGVLYLRPGTTTTYGPGGCDAADSPCQAASAYLAAYTTGRYEAMYALVSDASKTRFGDKMILAGNYTDAHDYIVNRTAGLLQQSGVYAVAATLGAVRVKSASTATVPAHVVMQTIRVGTITQDITLPLVREAGHWRVGWSPGVVFTQLDDPTDPQYQRRLHLFPLDGQRGRILDRDGNALAKNDTVYVVGVVPNQIKDEMHLLQVLATDLEFTPDQIKSLYQGRNPSEFVAVRTITQQMYTHVAADLTALRDQGVDVRQSIGRVYPYGVDSGPVTGYVAPVSDQDLVNDTAHYYEPGDTIGRAGIEAWAEGKLRPVKGGELDIVPLNSDGSLGAPAYTIARHAGSDGDDVRTTISIALQQKAMADMRAQQHSSGVASLDPVTGEVLVLASNPMYDPNEFALGFTPNQSAALNALDHPYLNRAVSAAYPIGSAFKVTTLSAGLEGGFAADHIFSCTGTFTIPGSTNIFHDDSVSGHGSLTEIKGLAVSCDVVFWQIAVALNAKDPNLLPTMAKAFGYGAPTGIVGLPADVENSGIVPDPQWLQQNGHCCWSAVDAANLAIGQGYFQATPLQIGAAAAAVANNGQRMQPRLVTAIVAPDGQTVATYPATVVGKLPIAPDHLAVIQAAMLGPTSDPQGTAYPDFANFPVRVAGKTGTSESGGPLPHSLFMCYAPASPLGGPSVTPRIAIGAIVERSGYGEQFAVPISKDLIKLYLNA
jgi:penicillin-binding protein 2